MNLLRFPSLPPFPTCFRLLLLSFLTTLLFVFTMWGSDTRYGFYHRLFNQSGSNFGFYQRLFNRSGSSAVFRPPAFYVRRVKVNLSATEAPNAKITTTTASQTPPPPSQTPPPPSQTPPPPPSTTSRPPPRFHQAYAPNYGFVLDRPDACKDPPFLALMVPVAPKNVAAREAIRQTWGREGKVRGERVLTLFVLGRAQSDPDALERENRLHGDLLQGDFMDSYRNLTIKTMVIMHWLSTRCSNATFAMKVDSDMFLNVENLVEMLKLPQVPRQNYLTGMLMWNRPVIRNKASKWFVPVEMYPAPTYPTYVLGAGYVFSCDLPARFVEASKTIRPFNIEDAYVGMCMKTLGLSPTPAPNPRQFQAYKSNFDRCQFSRVITYILSSPQQLRQYWSELKKPGPTCRRKRNLHAVQTRAERHRTRAERHRTRAKRHRTRAERHRTRAERALRARAFRGRSSRRTLRHTHSRRSSGQRSRRLRV